MEFTHRSHSPNQRHGHGHDGESEWDASRHLASLPTTPNRRNSGDDTESGFDVWFLELSNSYCLNLRRPNPSLLRDPKCLTSIYDDSRFYSRLKSQYRQGNADTILNIFDKNARAIHSKWVKKSNADHGVTPPMTSMPRASTEPERTTLLNKLAEILNLFSPYEPSCHAATDDSPSPSRSRRSKRRSQDEASKQSPSSKRSRGSVVHSRPPSALSRLDSGEVRGSAPVPELTMPSRRLSIKSEQQCENYGPSANTSRSSFNSRVFSEPERLDEDATQPNTQDTEVTTEEVSSHHRRKPPSSSMADSVAPSSSTERALVTLSDMRHENQRKIETIVIDDDDVPPQDFNMHEEPDLDHMSFSPEVTAVTPVYLASPEKPYNLTRSDATDFGQRLQAVWPVLPAQLQSAPLAVRWEILRVALCCDVSMEDLRFEYRPDLNDQSKLWDQLRRLKAFEGKVFPEKSRAEAWRAALSDKFHSTDQVVVLTANLKLNKSGLLFSLSLQPLKLDLPHRLDRRFGSDRFLELVIPSPYTREVSNLIKGNETTLINAIHDWLVRESHVFLGRMWKSFCVRAATPMKLHKDDTLKPETITIMQDRIYLFAEDGADFLRAASAQSVSPRFESSSLHTRMERGQLIDWLLQISQSRKNQEQSVYKLFSRITLGLSRTCPTVVLQPDQIRHRDEDILSPTGKVMNDGIARISTGLARQVRDIMGLDDIPACFQGRFGSAKGVWLRDTRDTSNEIWIETYPSQRKWVCDYLEEDHRTFEVRNGSKELRAATLNLQLLPILEDRATNATAMKERVGKFMKDSLEAEIESQKQAMKDPAHFKLWVYENNVGQRRQDRVRIGHVPWAAGLPYSREDQMELLLSQGFDPTKLEFLRKIAFSLRKEKCEELQTRLNVKVGRSTYAYMVVDFSDVLEEDEIHFGFSSKFVDEHSGFSETFLHGMDVLVARTPAHYPSDIQRVKAVFKPELGSLKDVIIFPTKGNIPLADKLSGGDYDGDIAWVCWEPSIVNNFTNAPLPDVPDLFDLRVLTKKKGTYADLSQSYGPECVTAEFIDRAFRFNMEPNLLGTCTNYKEKLCYSRNSVRDEHAIFMSTLISNLVDRAKQGIVFTEQDWNRERKKLNRWQNDSRRGGKGLDPVQPQYKNNDWGGQGAPQHIIDYVKFVAGKPTVERELENLNRYLSQAEHYDSDLVKFYHWYEQFKKPSGWREKEQNLKGYRKHTWETVLDELKKDIEDVAMKWRDSPGEFEARLSNTYDMWREIKPTKKVNSRTVQSLCEASLADVGLSQWDLLKASFCFKMYYKKHPGFPWYMAGYQLAYLKSIAVSQGLNAPPVLMTPAMYAGVKPDGKFVRAVAALNEGRLVAAARDGDDGGLGLEDVAGSLSDQGA
ncbi:hypothetical protein F4808DRAFT_127207 [Astrocystis sublimbata]|nr:hypothetical protein F4808DRAFT_127207 [Astrocystis sublimbata]